MFTIIVVFDNNDIKDVREILKDYRQYDDPIKVFRENQRILEVIVVILFHSNLFINYDWNKFK